ncbi:MAG TPA: hypothetical protein VGX69_02690 [Solirubrobacteraceae bacterium]|jgi:hypothetical protein|nr:hypothetical protein [Solirubrobacteraceae bacterium]
MTRLIGAWRALAREEQTAALVSLGLFVSMLLPWYSKTETIVVHGAASSTEQSLSAFQAFSFVEAAVLLVSAGVLAMLFARADGREFQLPGGDGTIVTIAGAWAAILIFYRLLDKPGLQGNAKISSTVGVQWGIFIALLVALGLVYSGRRIRASERGGPPLARPRRDGPASGGDRERARSRRAGDDDRDDEDVLVRGGAARDQPTTTTRPAPALPSPGATAAPAGPYAREARPRRSRPRYPPPPGGGGAPAEQMSFEDAPPDEDLDQHT